MGQSLPGACKLRSIATMVFGLVSEWNAMQRTFTVASLDFRYQPRTDIAKPRGALQRMRTVASQGQLTATVPRQRPSASVDSP